MKELISFFKDIFLMKGTDSKVGLCQFKAAAPVEKVETPIKISKEVKLSDLMRRSA